MVYDLENGFFSAYNGIVRDLIAEVREMYLDEALRPLFGVDVDEERQRHVEARRQALVDESYSIDLGMLGSAFSPACPLMDEIRRNIMELQGHEGLGMYLKTLLEPFRAVSDTFYHNSKSEHTACTQKVLGAVVLGEDGYTESMVEYLRMLKEVSDMLPCVDDWKTKFRPSDKCYRRGTIENALKRFTDTAKLYANRLDALLLESGINIDRIEEETGIKLRPFRDTEEVAGYLGGKARMEMLLGNIEQERTEQERTDVIPHIRKGKAAEKEIKVFRRAIAEGMMSINGNTYEWKGKLNLLAYMLGRLYSGDYVETDGHGKKTVVFGDRDFPETGAGKLFGQSVGQSRRNLKRTEKPPEGHEAIDELFKVLYC